MAERRCAFVKKGKKSCRNPVVEGFNFCKSHIYKVDSVIDYRVSEHLLLESSDNGQGFIFDSRLGYVYHLNATGFFLFSLMKENKPLSEITKLVSRRYGVDSERILSDFRDFCENLKDLGLTVQNERS